MQTFCTRPFPLFVLFNPEASVEALSDTSGSAVAAVAPYTLPFGGGFVPSLSRLGMGGSNWLWFSVSGESESRGRF